MGEIKGIEISKLSEAIVIWTGWGSDLIPLRDDSLVFKKFGAELTAKMLPVIKSLEDDFYSSNAQFIANDLKEMEKLSSEQFREKYPTIPDEIVRAFTWCYTYDYK